MQKGRMMNWQNMSRRQNRKKRRKKRKTGRRAGISKSKRARKPRVMWSRRKKKAKIKDIDCFIALAAGLASPHIS